MTASEGSPALTCILSIYDVSILAKYVCTVTTLSRERICLNSTGWNSGVDESEGHSSHRH